MSILIDGEALSNDQRIEIYAGDDIRIIQTAMVTKNAKPNAEIRLDAKAATKLYDFLLLHMDRIHRYEVMQGDRKVTDEPMEHVSGM